VSNSSLATDADVIVVGAGPVGLTTALLLAQHGVSVVVLDARATASEEGSKAICIQRDSLDICDRVGIATDMVHEGVTWFTGRTYYEHDELFSIQLPHDESQRFPPFINISQASTEALLVAQARGHSLIQLRYDQRVNSLSQTSQSVTVTTETANTSKTSRFTASYLIGCDGSRSIVRKEINATFAGHSFDEQFLIADIRCDLGFGVERRFYFDPPWNPGRQVLVHPCPDGVWRIDWQVPADFDLAEEQRSGALDARIRMITGDNNYEVVWLSVYRFHQRRASTFHVDRVLLAGDSAHIYAPFGARGLNAGFHDAENAAWKVAAMVKGWGGPALLPSYDAERGAAADENLRVTGETMQFLVPADATAAEHRTSLLVQARTDKKGRAHIQGAVNSGRLAEPYWYNLSPLTTGGSLAGFPTDPGVARPVCAGVLCPDVMLEDNTRLRSHFGSGFTLLYPLTHTRQAEATSANSLPTDVPIKVLRSTAIHTLLPAPQQQQVVVIRPDGYIAAITEPELVTDAVRRAAGFLPPSVS
jgi:3-(3-hydroxy-phenyl)propionate hydroxylase